MTPQSLLLSTLGLLSLLSSAAWSSPMCTNQCCRFVEGFPVRLKKLRENYSQIRDFYVSKNICSASAASHGDLPTICVASLSLQVMLHTLNSAAAHTLSVSLTSTFFVLLQEANNDLDSALLDQSVENSFNSQFACQAMDGLLEFYLTTVLPTAMAEVTETIMDLKPHVESILQIFDELKEDVNKCKNYLSCKNPFDITKLNSTYTQVSTDTSAVAHVCIVPVFGRSL
ncbi:hypothetical protein JOB18_009391 [Solea senegalensis]|uniref:Interleukin family protein n=1 Tax=Solea senegalensis TaxID=28829 RepID=A0AAV6QN12_SOLSE|nr:hypothetical protein JOB18_009391 [Solea senegalensis]